MNQKERREALFVKYQTDQLSESEFLELEEALRTCEETRALFHRAARTDSFLRREAESVVTSVTEKTETFSSVPANLFHQKLILRGLAAAAAIAVLSALTFTIAAQKRIVGTLVSSENAAWESALPTVEGAQLSRGSLRLSTGIATIRFTSGVDLTLEAPARVFLKGSKRASLDFGTVIVKAGGDEDFMLEAGSGQVVLREGECIASVDRMDETQTFEVISGAAFVSHDVSREAVKLEKGEAAVLLKERIDSTEMISSVRPVEQFERGLRIPSEDRSATFIRNNNPHKWTRPEFLSLKTSLSGNGFDQYSIVAFDLSEIVAEEIDAVTLRLNLVPSGIGLASRLPQVNRFAVYGLVNPAKENWSSSDKWEGAPSSSDGKLVGEFEIPRSQQAGTIEIGGAPFLSFVKEHAGASVSFILTRETANTEGEGHGLTHAMASKTHPEAAGPILEISLK